MTPTRNELAEKRAEHLPDGERRLYESFREMGMDAAPALAATGGRDGPLPTTDPYEELTESFERKGLSRSGARTAAAGRHHTEREVREALSPDEPEGKEPDKPVRLGRELTETEVRGLRRTDMYNRRADELHESGMSWGDALAAAEDELVREVRRRMANG